jgi:hypothetical protein
MDPVTLATTTVALLSPYLIKAGEKAAEEVGKALPDVPGKIWRAIMTRVTGQPTAEEAVKDVLQSPTDADNQGRFRQELRKALEADSTFATELEQLLGEAQRQRGDTIMNTGTGAVTIGGGVAVGAGGVAVQGDVAGGINMGGATKKE